MERSTHDGGGRLHPHERSKEGTDGGAEAAGTACPQEDGRGWPRRGQDGGEEEGNDHASTRRSRVTPAMEPGDVAVRAYLLWEQGEPGDATEHWLRAEQELMAA